MKKQTSKLKLPGKFDPQTRWSIGYFLVTLLVLWVWQGLLSAYRPRNAATQETRAEAGSGGCYGAERHGAQVMNYQLWT